MYTAGTIITLRAGAYRLAEPIATSSYGQVWRAIGPPTIGVAALKLVNRAQMARAGDSLRVRWADCASVERAVLASLQPWDQRHIVRLLDHGEHERLPVLALELLGADLRAAGSVPIARIVDWIGQVNQALAKVHQCGWRYLDLKPGNVLLDADGTVKLCDFGTVRALADTTAHEFTGTPGWQAPEQAVANDRGLHDTDARTDYFALGLLFYHLVSGGARLRYCQAQTADGPILSVSEAALFADRFERQGGGGTAALALLRTLLAPQRAQRPRHALDISRALAQIRDAMQRTLRSAA
ncbi:hypothetical protein GCM10027321_41490 [Massilia terrae]|uniref:Protein kinase n=1 Tax=Massilia terrae TaxID=1811224 RepID=A0ABT2CUK4_9BURK|nr:protein kinase [Massilia terrae]MCS0657659.1 protein kinase [Massilia terrae]